ncbi:hypothetical protein BFO01nite_55520 [Brevibacillus formosus]|uniref:Uncharacterized protein n=1 Tax=Brevibacillus formosus TaxID=54913 RepID=A0ABQ0TDT7_9BACL|nr:hypothetical protein BFO01nite_55520 [Brevibacillus formosus]
MNINNKIYKNDNDYINIIISTSHISNFSESDHTVLNNLEIHQKGQEFNLAFVSSLVILQRI